MSEKKILLVDDNPRITAISSHLEQIGFKMFNAPDGEKALEILKSDRPNLVILDMEMPGINGLEACEAIKKNPYSISLNSAIQATDSTCIG